MLKKIAKLIDVKSIVTLSLTFVFCAMMFFRDVIPDQFMNIYTVIIAFYFGTQATKKNTEE